MDVRVTPVSISRLTPATKYKPGAPAVYHQNHSSSLTTASNIRRGGTNQNVLIARNNRLAKPQTFNTSKSLGSNNDLLLISRKGTRRPRVFLKVTPDINQSPAITGNKKVMLYQQIERNKLLSNNSELVNRFNYKV